MDRSLVSMTASKLAPLLKEKSLSPVELTKAVLDHAETKQTDINAFMRLSPENCYMPVRFVPAIGYLIEQNHS